MAGPWFPRATGGRGRGRLRASDADREQVIDALKVAFVQGCLTKDELDTRMGLAFVSRTYAELAPITADLSGTLTGPRPSPKPGPAHTRERTKRLVAWGAAAVIVPAAGASFLTYYGGFIVLFVLAFIGATVTAQPGHGPGRAGPARSG